MIVVGQSCAVILTRTAVFAARTTAAGDRWSVLRTLCFLARGAEPAARTTTAAICTAVRSAGAVHNSTRTVGCGLLHVLLCMLHVLLLLLYVVLLLYTAVRWSAEQTLCFITRTAASGTNSSTAAVHSSTTTTAGDRWSAERTLCIITGTTASTARPTTTAALMCCYCTQQCDYGSAD